MEGRAEALLQDIRAGNPEAAELFATFHPASPLTPSLADARLALAVAHDYPDWETFQQAVALFNAICADRAEEVLGQVRRQPDLLHRRVNGESSNWGPPLACAAQVGAPAVFEALLPLPDQDRSWALDRAILKGRVDMARALIDNGTEPEPGLAIGPCETLNVDGLEFLAEVGVALTDEHGDRLAPVAMLLQGYHRDPEGKHACLAFFERQGIAYPDTPVMAFHRGRTDLLDQHLARNPELVHHRFSCRDLYPLELGCDEDTSLGLHGTPLDGTTLLHMSVDFDEPAIARWLLGHGADVNATAEVDAAGFGGHTPLFNAVVSQACVSGRQLGGGFARFLLDQGADVGRRASIRKAIRFIADESSHEYRDVTALEYGRAFHASPWVSPGALEAIEQVRSSDS